MVSGIGLVEDLAYACPSPYVTYVKSPACTPPPTPGEPRNEYFWPRGEQGQFRRSEMISQCLKCGNVHWSEYSCENAGEIDKEGFWNPYPWPKAPVKHHVQSSKHHVQSSIPVKHHVQSSTKHTLTREENRLGGVKGGQSRHKSLPPWRRAEIARKGALARWNKTQ